MRRSFCSWLPAGPVGESIFGAGCNVAHGAGWDHPLVFLLGNFGPLRLNFLNVPGKFVEQGSTDILNANYGTGSLNFMGSTTLFIFMNALACIFEGGALEMVALLN